MPSPELLPDRTLPPAKRSATKGAKQRLKVIVRWSLTPSRIPETPTCLVPNIYRHIGVIVLGRYMSFHRLLQIRRTILFRLDVRMKHIRSPPPLGRLPAIIVDRSFAGRSVAGGTRMEWFCVVQLTRIDLDFIGMLVAVTPQSPRRTHPPRTTPPNHPKSLMKQARWYLLRRFGGE
tara:strand:+ start:5110 stop:5637 length:528 start_codon:yes stop_codon:yes gene_type:complete